MRHRTDLRQSKIVHALRAAGCSVYVIGRPLDLLVGRRGWNYLLEVKESHSAPYTPFQDDFCKTWQGQWSRVTTVEEAFKAVGLTKITNES